MVVFDLDDTLYPERDYVQSAYRAIDRELKAKYPDAPDCYNIMWQAFCNDDNPLDALLDKFCPWEDRAQGVQELLHIYRFHTPELQLPDASNCALQFLKERGIPMAIITDGRSTTQRAKIQALGLDMYIKSEDVIVSEETGYDKHSYHNFCLLMQRHPDEDTFIYIADNPAKDFIHPNRLRWTTVMLRDTEGTNIHPQQIHLSPEQKPAICIDSLSQLCTQDFNKYL